MRLTSLLLKSFLFLIPGGLHRKETKNICPNNSPHSSVIDKDTFFNACREFPNLPLAREDLSRKQYQFLYYPLCNDYLCDKRIDDSVQEHAEYLFDELRQSWSNFRYNTYPKTKKIAIYSVQKSQENCEVMATDLYRIIEQQSTEKCKDPAKECEDPAKECEDPADVRIYFRCTTVEKVEKVLTAMGWCY